MKTESVNPNIKNFIKSLRDIGYSFEIAVADVLDNSITAKAKNVNIYTVHKPEMIFCLLDDGDGMLENELKEAMRLATKDPDDVRERNDLGRFGLGLKTASFSQCKKLTVISKKEGCISAKRWDLDYISKENKWLLITPEDIDDLPLINELRNQKHGTLVVWESIDRVDKNGFTDTIDHLKKHLSLVFHRFMDGSMAKRSLKITLNNARIKPFNPFNIKHPATQQIPSEKIFLNNSVIEVQPFILPHHAKVSQQEYEQYATEEGYIKSQGFYLYRENRLLIYGTWWRIHRATDAHKLIRIKIDISNDQDGMWGIDIKKSIASPIPELKKELMRIISKIKEKGSRVYTRRGAKIKENGITRFWEIIPKNEKFRFAINRTHPVYLNICDELHETHMAMLNFYLNGVEAYLPLESIQAQLQQFPHVVSQEEALCDNEIISFAEKVKKSNLPKEYIDRLLETELFKNKKELLIDEK